MSGPVVLDSTCFVQLWELPKIEGALLTTPQVVSEMKSAVAQARFAQAEGKVSIRSPGKGSLAKAGKIGESKLSEADRSVLALAIETGGRVATDDYALQNACAAAGVGVVPVTQKGITHRRVYSYRCVGCGRTFSREIGKCSTCGHIVKRVTSRPQPDP